MTYFYEVRPMTAVIDGHSFADRKKKSSRPEALTPVHG